jgi:fructokinase
MYDVISLGELLIDFIQAEKSEQGNILYEANPGGAPCNVLSILSNLGFNTAFLGKVGTDEFGNLLEETLKKQKIDTQGLKKDFQIPTTLAFVHKLKDGDRDFSFYRKPGADIMLTKEEIDLKLIDNCKIFHFGSLSLTDEPVCTATKFAVEYAKSIGKLISFDPNLRPPLWDDMEQARKEIWYGIEKCNILKIADNEIKWLTETDNYDKGVEIIRERSKVSLICVTLGREGSIAYYKDKKIYSKPFLNDKVIDTTGAGDTFCGCILSYILKKSLKNLSENNIREMLSFANGAASIITTRKGALCSMPTEKEILNLLKINSI